MKVLDLFSGNGGWSQAFRDRGHEVIAVERDPFYAAEITIDILTFDSSLLPWSPDIILASPPCERFSIARVRQWPPGGVPVKDDYFTKIAFRQVKRTVHIIRYLRPRFFIIENPVGLLRKLDLIPWEMRTTTQCQYGGTKMKKTDLWGGFPRSLRLKPPCHNGDPCHTPAPRGTRDGTQSMTIGYNDRAEIAYGLGLAVCRAAEKDLKLLRAPAR
jgi:C-5 cytosine-specific DNA methylase